ncbi:MAG TPA: hypothetical protein VLV48_06270, partial [Thermoanaerobaculia bacterium]|nr:hypothetical protein [Thermoanaerobaculia bacterium]
RTRERPLPPSAASPGPRSTGGGRSAPTTPVRTRAPRLLPIAIVSLLGAALLVGSYWWVEIRPRMKRLDDPWWGIEPTDPETVEAERISGRPVDRQLQLPGSPSGIAVNGNEIVIANRAEPWGFLRLRRDGDEFAIQQVPIIEEVYSQKMQFGGVTWNGTNYVSTVSGSWFGQKRPLLFSIHDAKTLRVLRAVPGPDDVGCLVWDGEGYWAATRKNTADEDAPQHLYRFDASLREIARHPSPIPGCQGMAWDGTYLWLADVFGDSIVVLDPREDPPAEIERRATPFSYLSGLAFAGKELWVAEYDDNRMHRVSPQLLAEWRAGKGEPSLAAMTGGLVEIRSMEAPKKALDSREESFPDTGPEDADLLGWSAEIRDGEIVASWRLHFGEELFEQEAETTGVISMPLFVRYQISVEGGTLEEKIEETYDAPHPGTVEKSDVVLASGVGPGTYRVDLFIHVQYVKADGTPHILNQSVFPLEVSW